jgi:hypothetical protein
MRKDVECTFGILKGRWQTTSKGGGLSGAMLDKAASLWRRWRSMPWSPPEEQSSPSETSPDTKDADSADGSRSAPSGELRSASVLSIADFSALRRAYLSDRVGGEVGVEGVDGATAKEAGWPALSPAKLASNFARSTAHLYDRACLNSLLIFFQPQQRSRRQAEGGPTWTWSLTYYFGDNLTPNPRHTRKDRKYRFLHT